MKSSSTSPIGRLVFMALATAVLCGGTLTGCGGNSLPGSSNSVNAQAKGRLQFAVKWPQADSRAIPSATNSLVVECEQNGELIGRRVLTRAQSSLSLECPVGTVTIRATAMPNSDGTGTPLAKRESTVPITENNASPVTLDLESTILMLECDNYQYEFSMSGTKTDTLSVHGRDYEDAIVPIGTSDLIFESSDPSVATVDATGKITAVDFGVTYIFVTEKNSGTVDTVSVYVDF